MVNSRIQNALIIVNYFDLSQDYTRETTLYFSTQPLDNWAYQNVNYNPLIRDICLCV
jgi:hypothetical protein